MSLTSERPLHREQVDLFLMVSRIMLKNCMCTTSADFGAHTFVAHRLYKHGETAVICFAPAMIVLMQGVQDPEERDSKLVRLVRL